MKKFAITFLLFSFFYINVFPSNEGYGDTGILSNIEREKNSRPIPVK